MATIRSLLNRRKNTIKFTCADHLVGVIPNPILASKALPEWFKNLSRDIEGIHKSEAGTIKRCVPVLDAMCQGFVIPLWADLYVKIEVNRDPSLNQKYIQHFRFKDAFEVGAFGERPLDIHTWDQVGDDCDLKKYPCGKGLAKFNSPWVIETPPDWSVQIKNPANNFKWDIRLMEGVVDSDTFHSPINLPFVWTGDRAGEWVIPKGTPLAQVIPFKRDDLSLEVGAMDTPRVRKTNQMIASKMTGAYRTEFWHKRKQS